ncbi:hypothetical protein HAX54_052538 [Datura stramonium]|uniref:Uncharacterized protein n=1 Tax=Datura stramonium TaxID=4076 RepID=A0ABS8T027_DATST|nr:hypothetical protein [Datura stramonium]
MASRRHSCARAYAEPCSHWRDAVPFWRRERRDARLERNCQNTPRHHGCSIVQNMLSGGEYEQEEVGYVGDIVPPLFPANANFDVTSTMMQLLSMKRLFRSLSASNKVVADGIAEWFMIDHTFAEASEILDNRTKTNRAWHTRESEAALELITKNLTRMNTQKVHVVNTQERGPGYEDNYPDVEEKANFVNNHRDFWANT